MPNNPPMKSPRTPSRRRSRSRTPHGQKKRHSSVETIRANTEMQVNTQNLRPYDSRNEMERTSIFRHEAGPGLLSVPGMWENEDSRPPRTEAPLDQVSDGTRDIKTLEDELRETKEENRRLGEENMRLMKGKASLRGAYDSLERKVEELQSRLNHGLGNKNKTIREGPANAEQGSGRVDAFRGTRSSQVSNTEVSALRAELTKCKKQIQELATKNRRISQTIIEQERRIQDQRTEFAQELDDLTAKAFVKGVRLSDTEIQTKWKTLGFSIRQFISGYFPEPLNGQAAQLLARQELFRWLPEPDMILQTPMLYQVALESWIWHFLCFQVFDSHSTLWAGEVGQTFRIQCDQFRATIANIHPRTSRDAAAEKFHDWRVRSADIISMLANTDEAGSAGLAAWQIFDLLSPAIPSTYFAEGYAAPELQQDLIGIAENAAQIAGIFRTSKADFQVFITRIKLPLVTPPSFGFPFDAETMALVKDIPQFPTNDFAPAVDLAVSPGILKTGNADGANYSSERVLVKLQTVCNLQSLLEFLHEGTMDPQVHESEQEAPVWSQDGCAIKEGQAGMEQQVHEDEQGLPVWREVKCALQEEQHEAAETDSTLIVVKEELEG